MTTTTMTLGTTITTMTLASDGDGVGALKKQEEVLKRLKVVSVDKNLICLLRQNIYLSLTIVTISTVQASQARRPASQAHGPVIQR